MKQATETIIDENGIELLISYEYEYTDGHYEEPNNIATWVEATVYTELKEVELVIAGEGISLLPILSEKQKQSIISKLSYE